MDTKEDLTFFSIVTVELTYITEENLLRHRAFVFIVQFNYYATSNPPKGSIDSEGGGGYVPRHCSQLASIILSGESLGMRLT